MSVILQYRAFVAGLAGYSEIPFDTFRNVVLPLRAKKVWTSAQIDIVQSYISLGASFSLQQLFGVEHPAAVLVLGKEAIKPELVSAGELHARMAKFGDACRLRAASPLWYIAALATLHSTEYKFDLRDSEKLFPGLSGFADEYRAASHMYKKIVDRHFAMLACDFPQMSQKWFQPVIAALEYKELPPLNATEYPWMKKFIKLGRRGGPQFTQRLRGCVNDIEAAYLAAEAVRTCREGGATNAAVTREVRSSGAAKKRREAKKRAQLRHATEPTMQSATEPTTEPAIIPVEPLPDWAQQICQSLEAVSHD